MRGLALLAVAVGLATTAGTVYAATGSDRDPIPVPSASAAVAAKPAAAKPGFFETYRGHHIMGWGENEKACAYIDGVQLVLYPTGDGKYSSNLQGFLQEPSVRAITKASVKTLGKLRMTTPPDGAAHCPAFTVREPAAAPAASAPTPAASAPKPAASAPRPAASGAAGK